MKEQNEEWATPTLKEVPTSADIWIPVFGRGAAGLSKGCCKNGESNP